MNLAVDTAEISEALQNTRSCPEGTAPAPAGDRPGVRGCASGFTALPRDHLGTGLQIDCGLGPTPFGSALLGWTGQGVCHLAFEIGEAGRLTDALARAWPQATLRRDDEAAARWLAAIFEPSSSPATVAGRWGAGGLAPHRHPQLLLRGTPFQLRVWQALLQTPSGQTLRYADLAERLGAPRSARAVGSALAANTIGWLVPCHRVVPGSGGVGHYRWGSARKMAMLVHETEGRSQGPCDASV